MDTLLYSVAEKETDCLIPDTHRRNFSDFVTPKKEKDMQINH